MCLLSQALKTKMQLQEELEFNSGGSSYSTWSRKLETEEQGRDQELAVALGRFVVFLFLRRARFERAERTSVERQREG